MRLSGRQDGTGQRKQAGNRIPGIQSVRGEGIPGWKRMRHQKRERDLKGGVSAGRDAQGSAGVL